MVDHLAAVRAAGCGVVLAALAWDDGGYFPRSWGWAGAVAAASGLVWLAAHGRAPAARLELLFLGALGASLLWALSSAAWSLSPPSSVAEAQRGVVPLAGSLAALALFRRRDAGALAGAVLGALTAVSAANLFGRATAGANEAAAAAPVGYVNALGLLAALGVLLALALARGRGGAAALATLPVNAFALVLAASTGAWGALGVGLAVAAVLAGGRLRAAGIAAFVLIVVAAGLEAQGHERERYWSAALSAARDQPVAGSGAGTFWQVWLREREVPLSARDAHGVYVETLGEQGAVGLALLCVALGTPLVAALRTRRRPLVTGAYAAFLAHAGIDWDWELAAVGLAGVLLGCVLLLESRAEAEAPEATSSARQRRPWLAAAVALLLASCLTFAGAVALDAARDSFRAHGPAAAERGRLAARLAPWAAEPWLVTAQAEYAQGRLERARAAALAGLERDANDWRLWRELARASDGEERERALARARSLNPLGP